MRKYDKIPIKIINGPIKVNHCTIVAAGPKVILAELDCKSKYFNKDGQGWSSEDGPCVDLAADENTLYYDRRFSKNSWTTIYFPTLKGWSIFAVDCARYTCYIAFWKTS